MKDYDETVFIEEALFRLVEVYYHLGVDSEANKYASALGFNYNSSEWYEMSYKLLNKDYEIIRNKPDKNKQKKNLLDKIINIIR